MIVVLTGAPGAGKGTQAAMLAERAGHRTISTGDALRRQVKAGTEIGKVAGAVMERGELVSDEILFEILKVELGDPTQKVVILDGYPRNVAQAETLDTLKEHPVIGAIQLDVAREELIERLSGRRVCGDCGATFHMKYNAPKNEGVCDNCQSGKLIQRADDNPDSVAVRLDVYEKTTKPVLDFYDQQGKFRKVVGSGSLEEISKQLQDVISGLQ